MTIAVAIKFIPIIIKVIQDIQIDMTIRSQDEKIKAIQAQLEEAFPDEKVLVDEVAQLVEVVAPLVPKVEDEVASCWPWSTKKK